MANHKSAKKRIRQTATRRLRNRYKMSTARTAIKKLTLMSSKTEASTYLPTVISMLDKLAKTNLIHKNKASNQKSRLTRFVNKLN
jgi:small subunit ribosomal protein S20